MEDIQGRRFFHGLEVGDGFGMIQVHDIYCVLYFYFVAISAYTALTSGLAFTLL